MTTKTVIADDTNQPICPKCGSKVVLYRVRTNDYLCRRCGTRFKKEQESK